MANLKSHHFVFVPGSFHASWCWYKMQPRLQRDGNTSEAIDLPAHGRDTTPIGAVSLESYVDAVCHTIGQYSGPVTLIGHSRAGIVISEVAERIPEKLDCAVYLCAFLIPHAEPMIATALQDTDSALVAGLELNESEGWHFPKSNVINEAFYNDCSEEDRALCASLLTREPNAPVATPLNLSEERFGSVRKVYIRTTRDRTISPATQQQMLERTRVDQVFELNSGHSPFLSQPDSLASILLTL